MARQRSCCRISGSISSHRYKTHKYCLKHCCMVTHSMNKTKTNFNSHSVTQRLEAFTNIGAAFNVGPLWSNVAVVGRFLMSWLSCFTLMFPPLLNDYQTSSSGTSVQVPSYCFLSVVLSLPACCWTSLVQPFYCSPSCSPACFLVHPTLNCCLCLPASSEDGGYL